MKNKTELVFILDRSGSMGGLESDTIGGFNAMLAKQQAAEGDCRITTVLFDNMYEILHDRIDVAAVKPITAEEYYVRGSTALLDAIGNTINKIGGVQKNTAAQYRADKVLFVITTDGMENASNEYTNAMVKKMIEQRKAEFGWEFIFLGANIDAKEVASRFGVADNRAQSFHNDGQGIELNFKVVSKAVESFRCAAPGEGIDDSWCEEIQADFESRK